MPSESNFTGLLVNFQKSIKATEKSNRNFIWLLSELALHSDLKMIENDSK